MGVFCVGCGSALEGRECAACGTPAVGADVEARGVILVEPPPNPPAACCCCLNPRDMLRGLTFTGTVERRLKNARIEFPWCRSCRRRRALPIVAGIVVFVLLCVIGVVVGGTAAREEWDAKPLVGCIGAGLVLGLIATLAVEWGLPDRPGHVRRCVGIEPGPLDGQGGRAFAARVVFRNRAFAKLWREANGSL